MRYSHFARKDGTKADPVRVNKLNAKQLIEFKQHMNMLVAGKLPKPVRLKDA
jgi:hypothetical protein